MFASVVKNLLRFALVGWVGTALWLAGPAWAFDVVNGDFRSILHSRSDATTVWRYSGNPNVFIFDFPGLTLQGLSFNRVMQLTEQQTSEPYPRPLTTEELTKYIKAARRTQADFAFGHDIMVSEFVQFFNMSDRDKVALNPEEIRIRDFLLEQGMIRSWRGFYQALQPNVVILSIPQPQERKADEPRITLAARYAILLHEMAHGEYYTNPYYKAYCQRFWSESLSDNQREAFKKFLANYGYSTYGDELLVNEMQAYLMFTPDQASFSARKLGVSEAELDAMRDAFRKGKPPTELPLNVLKGELL
ncbi:hypothetical protein B9N43_13635 [Denitratisoma sp. DHT3]|uniref:hypothetical protein n=1 Tax=Denitratisoma sp. DHT3 TaxID=1981880 RepID=UPI001198893B|nr:hypothetical protein [Denitratisoma sp. DHT3]QDX82195.1 hypothetical protein B9N43_13635 [Denitratisoma sp. DHT3]